ncbi:hypothetical protein [Hydrogenophaga sp. 5NK40-0174]|uniref:hypothetical protein n=1 Tax=Hydrogenophaga sp. 5NK40-0174 TaxID=3127649 RepID=UPI003342A463
MFDEDESSLPINSDALSTTDAQRWFYGGTPPAQAARWAYPFCDGEDAAATVT